MQQERQKLQPAQTTPYPRQHQLHESSLVSILTLGTLKPYNFHLRTGELKKLGKFLVRKAQNFQAAIQLILSGISVLLNH